MPNGRPGDHPLTDIVTHHIPTFTPEVDVLIREIHELGGFESELAVMYLFTLGANLQGKDAKKRADYLVGTEQMLRRERDRLLRRKFEREDLLKRKRGDSVEPR